MRGLTYSEANIEINNPSPCPNKKTLLISVYYLITFIIATKSFTRSLKVKFYINSSGFDIIFKEVLAIDEYLLLYLNIYQLFKII